MVAQRWTVAVLCILTLFWPYCNGTTGPECSTVSGERTGVHPLPTVDSQMAEQTQRQHLEALFNRYGENGTISISGLKRLLQSVGLDRIRKVMVQHHEQAEDDDAEAHGHTHHHHHHHHHQHHDHNSNQRQKHSHSETNEPKKAPKDPKVPKEEEPTPGKKVENSDAHHNLYVKKTTTSGQEMSTTPTYTTNVVVKSAERRRRRGAGDDLSQDSGPVVNQTHLDITEGEMTEHVSNVLISEDQTQPPVMSQEGSDDQHLHDHDHDEHLDQSLDHVEDKGECHNASSLLTSHGMTKEGVLTMKDFSYLCPALLNQIDRKSCIRHGDNHTQEETDHKLHNHHSHHHPHNPNETDYKENHKHSIAAAWVGGIVSITVISLLSLAGVVLIPLMNRVFFKFLLSFLVALAVGTLSGDAFLHLIPHSQGGHQHHHDLNETSGHGSHGEEDELYDLDPVWKGLTALSGVYIMFLIEHFLTLGKMYKDRKKKVPKKWAPEDKVEAEKRPALEENDLKPAEDFVEVLGTNGFKTSTDLETNGASTFGDHSDSVHGGSLAEEEEVMLAPPAVVATPEGYALASGPYTAEECENKCHSHFHDTVGQPDNMHHHHHDYHHILHHHHSQNHHPHSHSHSYSEQHFQQAGVAALAWMVIMGDGLHNFSDGLAIGAAFTEGLSSGLSTSVAVFCHELPHELGDFAVLLKAGMTVRQAILYNVLSAMMAYLGMIPGILIGHYAENVSMWIFALTAGLFMYVALVDMVPEMLHNDAGDHGFSHCGFFLLQNAGILLGFAIMLLIAIFEHKIHLDINI
ncbi:zinc transporter ZIP6 isoform X2 [Osmerus eperlanus]|uniref:zinc transporter ZIP6 isoform X2 n=1 Tax=Osmerus eperlanus TaxID=29151 RepID=UPI002E12939B